jgi:hypothetical protein
VKFKKYAFRTPLFGSIDCEELLPDTDGRIELSPEQMCRMYSEDDTLLRFLTDNMENLVHCVPEELKDTVLCAEFGDCAMLAGRMYLVTYIYTERSLTDEGIAAVQEWIRGQMSDGWGEGLEQRVWKRERVVRHFLYFDEYTLEFEEDQEDCSAEYYVHPWSASDDFLVILEYVEEVEEDTTFEIVATMSIPNHERQVVKIPSGLALKKFLTDYNAQDMIKYIEDTTPMREYIAYLVIGAQGKDGADIMHRWACQSGEFCALYEMEPLYELSGACMPVSKAVMELLK